MTLFIKSNIEIYIARVTMCSEENVKSACIYA